MNNHHFENYIAGIEGKKVSGEKGGKKVSVGKRCQEPFLGLPRCLKVISRPKFLTILFIQLSSP